MSNSESNSDYDEEIFGSFLFDEDDQQQNQRIAVRYIRTDITVSLTVPGLFGFSSDVSATLIDISSKGVAIECKKKLTVKNNVSLTLLFDDKTQFTIATNIVHKKNDQYGLKFACLNNKLGDYLLSSQNDLLFK